MDTTTTPDGPTPLETLNGGSKMEVILSQGQRERVEVRQLPVREFSTLLNIQTNEEALAELYTGAQPGWAATLTRESLMDVVDEGERLNSDFFGRWARRRTDTNSRLAAALGQTKQENNEPKTLRFGSQKSPSLPG